MQEAFLTACLHEAEPPAGAATMSGDPTHHQRRIGIYGNAIRVRLTNSLSSTYKAVYALIGEACFEALARRYMRAHPPQTGCLYGFGDAFSAFITDSPLQESLPYLAEVAAFEWAWQSSYRAANSQPLPPEWFTTCGEDALTEATLSLRPDVRLLATTYPVEAIWRYTSDPDALTPPELTPGRYYYLIHRPALEVRTEQISAALWSLLTALNDGYGLADAAEQVLTAEPNADLDGLFTSMLRLNVISIP